MSFNSLNSSDWRKKYTGWVGFSPPNSKHQATQSIKRRDCLYFRRWMSHQRLSAFGQVCVAQSLPGRKILCTVIKAQTAAAGENLKLKYKSKEWLRTLFSGYSELDSGIQFHV